MTAHIPLPRNAGRAILVGVGLLSLLVTTTLTLMMMAPSFQTAADSQRVMDQLFPHQTEDPAATMTPADFDRLMAELQGVAPGEPATAPATQPASAPGVEAP